MQGNYSTASQQVAFSVAVQNDARHPRRVQLKALCGPGYQGEPVITIMLPEDDYPTPYRLPRTPRVFVVTRMDRLEPLVCISANGRTTGTQLFLSSYAMFSTAPPQGRSFLAVAYFGKLSISQFRTERLALTVGV